MGVIRVGGSEGVAGRSLEWELKTLGGTRVVSWRDLREGLRTGRYSGIESVRRLDGDWGPLFGRPMYREVFGGQDEPRDHAKARAAARIQRLQRWMGACLVGCITSLVVGLPFLTGGVVTQVCLVLGLALGLASGLLRLRTAMHAHELATLTERLIPPVREPPPIDPDWAALAAADEVEHTLRERAEE